MPRLFKKNHRPSPQHEQHVRELGEYLTRIVHETGAAPMVGAAELSA